MFAPININLKDKLCIVAGAGPVALRKINNLLKNKARVMAIAEEVKEKRIGKLFESKKIKLIIKKVSINDFKNAFMVVLATDDIKLNDSLAKELDKRNILVNNTTGGGNFIFPAVLNKGSLKIAVSTEGDIPFLSKAFRDKIEGIIPEDFSEALKIIKKYRLKAKKVILNKNKKINFYNEISNLVLEKDFKAAGFWNKIGKFFKIFKIKSYHERFYNCFDFKRIGENNCHDGSSCSFIEKWAENRRF